MTTLTPEHLEVMFGSLLGCCLHNPTWTPVDVDKVLCSIWNRYSEEWQDCAAPEGQYGAWKDGTDSISYTVVRLKDGRFGLLSESEDYTGHGCQCGAATSVYGSLGDLLRFGIEEWASEARQVLAQRLAVPGDVLSRAVEIEQRP